MPSGSQMKDPFMCSTKIRALARFSAFTTVSLHARVCVRLWWGLSYSLARAQEWNSTEGDQYGTCSAKIRRPPHPPSIYMHTHVRLCAQPARHSPFRSRQVFGNQQYSVESGTTTANAIADGRARGRIHNSHDVRLQDATEQAVTGRG